MGLLDKLRTTSAGILTAAKPAPGVEPAPLEVVADRLLHAEGRDLRDPVLDAVTGAGWTYRPKRF